MQQKDRRRKNSATDIRKKRRKNKCNGKPVEEGGQKTVQQKARRIFMKMEKQCNRKPENRRRKKLCKRKPVDE